MKHKLVLIIWHDAKLCRGMHTTKEAMDDAMDKFESPGYIIAKDKITTRLAKERNDSREYRDIALIPTGSIISIQSLTISHNKKQDNQDNERGVTAP